MRKGAENFPNELRPWASYGRKQGHIRDIDVAELLAPYGVKPLQLKVRGHNRRGYRIDDIEAAIDRYVAVSDQDFEPVEVSERRYPATHTEKPRDSAASSGSGGQCYHNATATADATAETNGAEVAATEERGATGFLRKINVVTG